MKGMLVIGMVIAHALQLLSQPRGLLWLYSSTINLITFSGFFFCFGYVFYLSYLSRPLADVKAKMAKTAAKSLVAYYLSGFSAYLLLSNRLVGKPYSLSFDEGLQLVTFAKVAWYSEFLLTFFLITLLVLVLFQGFKRLTNSPVAMLLLSVACLLTAILLPSDLVVARPLSLLVGTKGQFIFPVIQYLPVFLAGLYFAKYKLVMNKVALILAAVGTSVFMTYYLIHRTFPAEFSPSIYWLVGSYGILYGYFLGGKMARASNQTNKLASVDWE